MLGKQKAVSTYPVVSFVFIYPAVDFLISNPAEKNDKL